jgi:A/G-specific adenine glycosylase
MLQQTQVATVLGYYARFLERFPDVAALAAAPQDEVLGLWSGLGYYSRARNLHRCAQDVVQRFGGAFPRTAAELETLPGIGRSTAAAIASFCFGERVAILDGNVKRVLTRVLAFEGDLAKVAQEKRLWDAATALLPADAADMPAYTQGLMDLGATVCLPRKPSCLVCPASARCEARRQGRPTDFPVRTRNLRRSAESHWLLWAVNAAGEVWLQQRPQQGVWAGLYCLPAFNNEAELMAQVPDAHRASAQWLDPFTHVLTHKDLHLHPVRVALAGTSAPGGPGAWVAATDWPALGLPAPVRRLLSAT